MDSYIYISSQINPKIEFRSPNLGHWVYALGPCPGLGTSP